MRLILDRAELADLVIPDLARWEDWTQIDKLSELFKSADEKSSWVRVPVINYLRACPLTAAETRLAELKQIDPAAFKRATSFFPVPKATSGTTDSSYVPAVHPTVKSAGLGLPPNRSLAVSVLSLASATVWLAMWLTISGPSTPAWMGLAVRRWF